MTIGCIHGRFQPFHNGHFEYLKAAYERSERLIVGITQYDQAVYDQGSPAHRLNVADNPFTATVHTLSL
jgi:cytidyltransferase-like protein